MPYLIAGPISVFLFHLGLNGFNLLFPANQVPGPVSLPLNRLPSLNVPCMMVPSTAFAPFPLIYSPAVTSQLSSAPAGSFPNVTYMNLAVPGLASTTPVFIGTPAVVAPNSSQLSTLEPPQQIPSAVHLSPVLGSACSSVKTESPVCMGHPVTLLKLQQVSVMKRHKAQSPKKLTISEPTNKPNGTMLCILISYSTTLSLRARVPPLLLSSQQLCKVDEAEI